MSDNPEIDDHTVRIYQYVDLNLLSESDLSITQKLIWRRVSIKSQINNQVTLEATEMMFVDIKDAVKLFVFF